MFVLHIIILLILQLKEDCDFLFSEVVFSECNGVLKNQNGKSFEKDPLKNTAVIIFYNEPITFFQNLLIMRVKQRDLCR